MSYQFPIIKPDTDPVGIEIPIESIREELKDLPWLQYSFGRAFEFSEKNNATGRVVKVPKVYDGDGEYLNVLPNDHWKAYSFIMCDGAEEWTEYNPHALSHPKQRKLNIIFWFNLKEISLKDKIQTERLKKEVEAILKHNPYISSIDSFIDEKVEDVFKNYVSSGAGSINTVDDDNSQYLMYPYSGFRFDVTAVYYDNC